MQNNNSVSPVRSATVAATEDDATNKQPKDEDKKEPLQTSATCPMERIAD